LDFAEVARLTRNSEGREVGIAIRSEYLRDYLAARSMALRVCTYRSRTAVLEDASHIEWSEHPLVEEVFGGRFEGRAAAIHEGGFPFGAQTAVFQWSRTDVDTEAEVPVMERPTQESVKADHWSFRRQGRKLFRVEGEFWRDEWLEPASKSPRVKGDHIPSETTFVINGAGERVSADELNDEDIGKWLWFRPEIANTILARRGGNLDWYTGDTGGLEMSAGGAVHFGLNERGLLNAYAYDIARLDEWERRIWAGFNVAPDGGVSQELTASHVYAEPAPTQAPEASLTAGLEALDGAFQARFGHPLIPPHPERDQIISRTHRFRATDLEGLLALAKDLARLTADSFDASALNGALGLKREDRMGSLKALQAVLASIVGDASARKLMGPLVGVYDLRLGEKRANQRSISARTPAVKGQSNIKDCIVTETYLGLASKIALLNPTAPLLFVSSNTTDYAPNAAARAQLKADFDPVGLVYYPNLSAAMHAVRTWRTSGAL
jgi:hypothetical protein